MITVLYVTYFAFAGIVGITTAFLLFKLSFTHAVLIVGFSILAWLVRVWGNVILLQKQQEILAKYQDEVNKELAKQDATTVANSTGMN